MFKVKLISGERLKDNLNSKEMVDRPLSELLQKAASIGRKQAVDAIDGGTGIATRSISKEVKPMQARVFTAMSDYRAMSIEEGRKPGDVPSRPALEKWAKAVGYPGTVRELYRVIEFSGVKGKKFMAGAGEKIEKELPQLTAGMEKNVEGKFDV